MLAFSCPRTTHPTPARKHESQPRCPWPPVVGTARQRPGRRSPPKGAPQAWPARRPRLQAPHPIGRARVGSAVATAIGTAHAPPSILRRRGKVHPECPRGEAQINSHVVVPLKYVFSTHRPAVRPTMAFAAPAAVNGHFPDAARVSHTARGQGARDDGAMPLGWAAVHRRTFASVGFRRKGRRHLGQLPSVDAGAATGLRPLWRALDLAAN